MSDDIAQLARAINAQAVLISVLLTSLTNKGVIAPGVARVLMETARDQTLPTDQFYAVYSALLEDL